MKGVPLGIKLYGIYVRVPPFRSSRIIECLKEYDTSTTAHDRDDMVQTLNIPTFYSCKCYTVLVVYRTMFRGSGHI